MHDETFEHAGDEPAAPGEAIIEVDIEAEPSDVWHALITDDGLASWIGEGSTIGSKPGDDLYVHDIVTGKDKRGVLDEVTPHRRLGYTWWPETEPERATRVAISLEPWQGGTRVTVVESQPLPTPTNVPAPLSASACAIGAAWEWRAAMLAVGVVWHRTRLHRPGLDRPTVHSTFQATY